MTKDEFMAMSFTHDIKMVNEHYLPEKEIIRSVFSIYKNGRFKIDGINMCLADCIDGFKLVLHSLSDLTKPIEHKGEVFIPIVKLFEYLETRFFDNDIAYKPVFEAEKIISIEYKEYKWPKMNECILTYMEDYTNTDSHIKSFRYSSSIRRFLTRDETEKRPLGVAYQLDLFLKLIEWHFDIAGLIEKGEAIDVSTLQENPYK